MNVKKHRKRRMSNEGDSEARKVPFFVNLSATGAYNMVGNRYKSSQEEVKGD